MGDGRFQIGDQVTGKGTGVGVIVAKESSQKARLVGNTAWIYRVNGPGFNPDSWYAESSLVLAN